MSSWSTDKIVGSGLVVSLIIAALGDVLISLWTGTATYGTLAKDITLGLAGYLGRGAADHMEKSKASDTIGKVAATAVEAQKAIDAVETIQKIAGKKG